MRTNCLCHSVFLIWFFCFIAKIVAKSTGRKRRNTIAALSQMESGNAGKMGLMTVAYYATTAVIASAVRVFSLPNNPAVIGFSGHLSLSSRTFWQKSTSAKKTDSHSHLSLSLIKRMMNCPCQTGIFFVTMIAPGTSTSLPHSTVMNTLSTGDVEPIDTFLDLFRFSLSWMDDFTCKIFRNMFPDNIFKATFQRVNTKWA